MLVRQWRERERDEQTLVERVESEVKSLTLVNFSVQVGFEELDLTHSLPKLLIPFHSNPIQSEQLELLRFIPRVRDTYIPRRFGPSSTAGTPFLHRLLRCFPSDPTALLFLLLFSPPSIYICFIVILIFSFCSLIKLKLHSTP